MKARGPARGTRRGGSGCPVGDNSTLATAEGMQFVPMGILEQLLCKAEWSTDRSATQGWPVVDAVMSPSGPHSGIRTSSLSAESAEDKAFSH